MRRVRFFFIIGCIFILAACGAGNPIGKGLPFPTPAQHDLVVLVHPSALSYTTDENGNPSGLEYDLVQLLAEELGVGIQLETVRADEMSHRLARDDYHIAIGWLSPEVAPGSQTPAPLFLTHDLLIQNDASLPLRDKTRLAGKTIHVMAGSRQAITLRRLAAEPEGPQVVEFSDGNVIDLLEKLGNRRVAYVAVDDTLADTASQLVPGLRGTLTLGDSQPVTWLLGSRPNVELRARVEAFIERVQHDGTLARLEDRYLGHLRRLDQADLVRFLGEIEATLPKYRKYFQAAQVLTGIDWRLIAAVSYHESQWDPNATSYTNVRGIMMLTEDTADRLQVSNRLDPNESILAGARYINLLREQLADETEEPDRTWLALAAYNIGPGHFNAARTLARQLKADPGACYDILLRNTPPLAPSPAAAESLKRLVTDIEQRRKEYARKMAAAKAIAADNGNDNNSRPLRLPTIEPNDGN